MSLVSSSQASARTGLLRFVPRPALIAFGWLNVVLGVIGVILPIMPTTVFLLIALWAFSNSSPQFHDWLYTHPRFGPVLQAWHRERAIPGYAKALALTMMAISIAWLAASTAPAAVVMVVSIGLGVMALWIVTRARPSAAGTEQETVPIWRRAL